MLMLLSLSYVPSLSCSDHIDEATLRNSQMQGHASWQNILQVTLALSSSSRPFPSISDEHANASSSSTSSSSAALASRIFLFILSWRCQIMKFRKAAQRRGHRDRPPAAILYYVLRPPGPFCATTRALVDIGNLQQDPHYRLSMPPLSQLDARHVGQDRCTLSLPSANITTGNRFSAL